MNAPHWKAGMVVPAFHFIYDTVAKGGFRDRATLSGTIAIGGITADR